MKTKQLVNLENRVLIIGGPTCSGKTTLAILLAKALNSEVISADSRQVFKYLDIGTAKPTKQELSTVHHHLIDFIDPTQDYNASKFEDDALRIIKDLHKLNKIPIVAGGSSMYLHALVHGITDSVVYDERIRQNLLNVLEEKGREHLYMLLRDVDPISADKMLPQNYKRVLRALEVYYSTGKPIWQHHLEFQRDEDLLFNWYVLNWDRANLYSNINTRVDEMVVRGLVDEAIKLKSKYSSKLNALNTVGYKEVFEYLNGDITLEKAVELIKRNTRHYAKKQLTWLRRESSITWLSIHSSDDLFILRDKIVSQL